ncbi:MAG TPA: succinyldiaminopimelate transaminase [Usitatibacter sp.]|jgi:N-succinyldiaminopimelate aminotransferase|nr:succinyldiaminopimelate transaminase [Usitatibacter sp.]
MNPRLGLLQPYPFEKLRGLLAGAAPPPDLRPIPLSLGEPQHPTPPLIKEALVANLGGLARYPQAIGLPELRAAIADWLVKRHGLDALDPATQVIPVLGSKEALFALPQAVLDPAEREAIVISPNPFYQIYEGATLLAGARPYYVNAMSRDGFRPDWRAVPAEVWSRTRMVYTCSPGNPTGRVMELEEWRELFQLSDRHGFVVVSDECYSEIYFDEARAPLGALAAAKALGRTGYPRLVVMGSLSKRSSAPGLRSGFAAGDAAVLAKFMLYRTYHGSAMSNMVQLASIAAWRDERHVAENRRLYREKFATFRAIVGDALPLSMPSAAFYYWVAVPGGDDLAFTRELFARQHVTVLPGSYIARDAHGVNPGRGFVRIALVSTVEETVEAAQRVKAFAESYAPAVAPAAR